MCGGTGHRCGERLHYHGLSPRVRGNPATRGVSDRLLGSIPACAGEPSGHPGRRRRREVYPRVCGGTRRRQNQRGRFGGLSPRVRGNHHAHRGYVVGLGSIPACAGEPEQKRYNYDTAQVYPRVCGGTVHSPSLISILPGLSPRVRGNHSPAAVAQRRARSIPACAGEPADDAAAARAAAVYPRVCGGTDASKTLSSRTPGLSPRVRGNQVAPARLRGWPRSIPACAGEPPVADPPSQVAGVYPRVCGGTCPGWRGTDCIRGLSPRVRGNPNFRAILGQFPGSIPACAGEPQMMSPVGAVPGVYPRVCGGTRVRVWCISRGRGLSPRVRGNPMGNPAFGQSQGSIPACAGEPDGESRLRAIAGVYPRVCGGTLLNAGKTQPLAGLSPRVRGNPIARRRDSPSQRSIPACAGEPPPGTESPNPNMVYPRVCGGTWPLRQSAMGNAGLSPRVRGNPQARRDTAWHIGSIPACAGEPRRRNCHQRAREVYPRVCGGTVPRHPCRRRAEGLSPRVRGNLMTVCPPSPEYGSISACAGEPVPRHPCRGARRVYPRVCGGTRRRNCPPAHLRGLSPRVRGNHGFRRSQLCRPGSIPACAGEPLRLAGNDSRRTVYPRVCGGTAGENL